MDIDNTHPTSGSTSSSSTPNPTPPIDSSSRRFKLDPMSLLLPHEREVYQRQQKEQQRAIREQQKREQQQRQQQQVQDEAKGFYSGSGHQAWEASVRGKTAPAVVGKDTRQTSSMGDQSGRQGQQVEQGMSKFLCISHRSFS